MRKLGLIALVLAVLLLTRGAAPEAVVAQVKKDAKKGAPAAAGVIEIGEGKDGKFRFFVRNDEGKLLAMSGPGGFASVKDAEAAIRALKEVVSRAKVTTLKKGGKDGK
jgi:uncharacterized protein YegP (UPF0339 family)